MNQKINQMEDSKTVTEGNAPVLIVKDGKYLVHAGQPETFNKKLLVDYAKRGYTIQTITIKKFRETNWTWYWEKNNAGIKRGDTVSSSSTKPKSSSQTTDAGKPF